VVINAKSVVGTQYVWNVPSLSNSEAVDGAEACCRKLAARTECEGDRYDTDTNERHEPNEKEISHGRVWWQTCWAYFVMGPLASLIG
jgi:hypothetical protein